MRTALKGVSIDLRKIRMSDSESIRCNANDRDIAKYLYLPLPYKASDARAWIRRSNRLFGIGKAYHFGIEYKESGEIIGMIGLRRINREDRNAEVGYWLGKKYRGRGFMDEALKLILDFAFRDLRLVRVYAVVHSTNSASWRLIERSGFKREGTWRRASFLGRRWNDVYSYGILKDEFKGG